MLLQYDDNIYLLINYKISLEVEIGQDSNRNYFSYYAVIYNLIQI